MQQEEKQKSHNLNCLNCCTLCAAEGPYITIRPQLLLLLCRAGCLKRGVAIVHGNGLLALRTQCAWAWIMLYMHHEENPMTAKLTLFLIKQRKTCLAILSPETKDLRVKEHILAVGN